jgi:hypothetical protein
MRVVRSLRSTLAAPGVAYYALRLGSRTLSGTLLLDSLTQTYRGLATLESVPVARAQLDSLVLEDYSGTRQIYRF